MRHGTSLLRPANPPDLSSLLLAAAVARTLASPSPLPTTTTTTLTLLLHLLRRPSIPAHRKLLFFLRCASSTLHPSPAAYSSALRVLACAGLFSDLPPLLLLIRRHAVPVDPPAFKLLLDAVIGAAKFDLAIETLDVMEAVGVPPNAEMYGSVLVAFVRKGQLDLGLSVFYKLVEASEVESIAPFACNELLSALRKAGMREELKKVFGKLVEVGYRFDTCGYNICIHSFGCWGELGVSLKLFKEMKLAPSLEPDLCTYNCLLRALFTAGKAKDALGVWGELKNSGHEPDEYTYRIMIHGCSRSYKIEDAKAVFREMQSNGFAPGVVVFNSLLNGLFKANKLSEACLLFEKMVQDGVRASSWTYNIMIDGLIRNGRAAAGYGLFCDLKKKGQFVDGVTYSIVVVNLCREGELEAALELVEEMEERGLVVDLVTVTSLLIGLHRHQRWDWAEQLMRHVRDSTLVPNVLEWKAKMEALMKAPQDKRKDYSSLFESEDYLSEILAMVSSSNESREDVDANGRSEDVDANGRSEVKDSYSWSSSPYMDQLAEKPLIEESLQQFSLSKGRRVEGLGSRSFDIDMVNTYMSVFLSKGKLSVACKLFEVFAAAGKGPDKYTYNLLMCSFVKKGCLNEAWGVFREMSKKLCPADIATYNIIIQGLGKIGKSDLAGSVLNQLMKKGGYLDIVMYNTLLYTLGRAGHMDEVDKLFGQMTSSGINPDVVTFNTLIEVHTKAGRVKDAYKYLKMMLDAGCSPNHVTDTTLEFLEREMEKHNLQKD